MNDLGDYYRCNRIESTKYTVIEITSDPIIIYTFCGPEVCTKEDYYKMQVPLANISIPSSSDVIFPQEYQENHYGSYSIGAIFMLAFIGILVFICITSTIVDIFSNDTYKFSKYGKILLCFLL